MAVYFNEQDTRLISEIKELWLALGEDKSDGRKTAIAALSGLVMTRWKDVILEAAQDDRMAFDAVMEAIKVLDRNGKSLPLELQHFVVQVACHKRKRPAQHGPHPARYARRNHFICEIIKQLLNGGYSLADSKEIICSATGMEDKALGSVWQKRYQLPEQQGVMTINN